MPVAFSKSFTATLFLFSFLPSSLLVALTCLLFLHTHSVYSQPLRKNHHQRVRVLFFVVVVCWKRKSSWQQQRALPSSCFSTAAGREEMSVISPEASSSGRHPTHAASHIRLRFLRVFYEKDWLASMPLLRRKKSSGCLLLLAVVVSSAALWC